MQPFFLDSRSGPLFAVYWPPIGLTIRQAILHVPAFGEEMNKSRRMVALQAREFAKQGYSVLILDLFGTGDSAGDFGDATWKTWLENIDNGIDWLIQQGAESITLWGLRTGALLAMDVASRSHGKIDHILCWQPVVNGDSFMTQFLRLRLAAAIMDSNAPREKTSLLKRQLMEGQPVEVAGYLLNPELVLPLAALRADRLLLQGIKELVIFEVVASEEAQVSGHNSQFLGKVREHTVDACLIRVIGDAFWATQEITSALDLIAQTNERVSQWL